MGKNEENLIESYATRVKYGTQMITQPMPLDHSLSFLWYFLPLYLSKSCLVSYFINYLVSNEMDGFFFLIIFIMHAFFSHFVQPSLVHL